MSPKTNYKANQLQRLMDLMINPIRPGGPSNLSINTGGGLFCPPPPLMK